jgi:hypothetical protein
LISYLNNTRFWCFPSRLPVASFYLMAYQQVASEGIDVVEPTLDDCQPPSPTQPSHQFEDGFQNIDFDLSRPTSTTNLRTIKHAPQWSSSTNTTAKESEECNLQSDRRVNPTKLARSGTWASEILTLSIGIGAVISILGVIARFNGRALPKWPYDITLNAVIALLATVANATMSVSLSSGISQSKWIRFKQSATPLSDIEVFDEASRGSWGAAKLLVTAKGGYVVTFGRKWH